MSELSTSSYYYSPKFPRDKREQDDTVFRNLIEQVQERHPGSGYRTVQQYLYRDGVEIGERKLRRIMGKFGLWAEIKKAFVSTTDSDHDYEVYPNLIRAMKITGSNQVWASDITYIRIKNGFVYLAVILDLFSRKVIGWAISKHIDQDLALNALRMAVKRRKPPRGVIHHSDRGVQYVCRPYVKLLLSLGFHISNSSKGNPYDNAFLESFMKTLKRQEVYLANYETYLDVIENVPRFLEEIYNEKRVHSSIEYLTPNELEEMEKKGEEDITRFGVDL